jgi:serine/threonine-protein kinase HipA
MTDELVALLDGKVVGFVRRQKRTGKLLFAYEDNWRGSDEAYPLSLSMPLDAVEHGHGAIEPFLWGLLPDNEQVLDRWARRFQVSARNVFGLIANVGEDCAGAVQFVPADRLDSVQSGADDRVDWLSEAEIARRLKTLREDHAAWRLPGDTGQFSLAGAQPKTAFLFQNRKWGIPSGRLPTTHILKPPTGHFDGHAENEHICLSLAGNLGLPAAQSAVLRFEDEIAISVERYDRLRSGNRVIRVHQEDVCQALGVPPTRKYQNDGGPGVVQIAELLKTYSSNPDEDVQTLADAIGFNWLIAGTDAHAKNYSLLLSSGSRVRLAPLYDVASLLPYKEYNPRKAKLAMKIGGEYRLYDIGIRQWEKFARDVGADASGLIERLRQLAIRLPDEASAVHRRARKSGLENPTIERLVATLTERARSCAELLAKRGKSA